MAGADQHGNADRNRHEGQVDGHRNVDGGGEGPQPGAHHGADTEGAMQAWHDVPAQSAFHRGSLNI